MIASLRVMFPDFEIKYIFQIIKMGIPPILLLILLSTAFERNFKAFVI